uniref:Sulfotransferase domain-containing protein n=1 Tax=viral metagenome TaxID=1070528 RepID=A0A6C0ET43_9ZZZZ
MIAISGTGRCGTTFLMIIFIFLKFNTGFTEDKFDLNISSNCNSGLENIDINTLTSNFHIVKHPQLIDTKDNIIKFISNNDLEHMIIPIRNLEDAARSREKLGGVNGGDGSIAGGLWKANNYREQLDFYHKVMAQYLETMVIYDIPTIFIDFKKMINNPRYLYFKLIVIFDKYNISFKVFKEAYIKADNHQKKK